LLAIDGTNEFYVRSILSVTISGIHVSLLITAFGVVAMQNRLYAEEQSAAASSTTVIADGVSSNPGAVDIRTGTGELAEAV